MKMAAFMFVKVLLFFMVVSMDAFVLENNRSGINGLKGTMSVEKMLSGGGNCIEDNECAYEGICVDSETHKSCACRQGLDGDYCEIVVDCFRGRYKYCRGVNGSCIYSPEKEEAQCVCEGHRVFDSKNNICKDCDCGRESKNCSLNNDAKVCGCVEGYRFNTSSGKCEAIDVCDPNPCVNGHCIKNVDDYMCVCDPPFTGRFCEISTCIETKCSGGQCKIRGGTEYCFCPDGFQLQNGICIKNKCVPAECFGGICETQVNGDIICVCPKGFHLEGIGCKETVCVKKRCFGGKCQVIDGEEICTCKEGYFLIEDVCEKIICKKPCYGGKCIIIDGKEECSCPVGYKFNGESCISEI